MRVLSEIEGCSKLYLWRETYTQGKPPLSHRNKPGSCRNLKGDPMRSLILPLSFQIKKEAFDLRRGKGTSRYSGRQALRHVMLRQSPGQTLHGMAFVRQWPSTVTRKWLGWRQESANKISLRGSQGCSD